MWGEGSLIARLLHGHRARIHWLSLLIASIICAPLAVYAAPPTVPPGVPGQGVASQPFFPGMPPGGQFPPGLGPNQQVGAGPNGPPGARIGPTNPQQPLTLAISLKVQDQHALDTFLHDLYDPASPNFRHYLSPADFTKRFITTGRQQVTDFLKNAKLTVNDRGVGSLLTATGTVDQIQTAFKVSISDYQDPSGTVYSAADGPPTLPSIVSPSIQSVIGLDNTIKIKTHMVPMTVPNDVPAPAPSGTPGTTPPAPPPTAAGCDAALNIAANYGAFTPNQIATAYNFNPFTQRGEQGQGQILALIEVDDFKDVNVAAYQSCFGTNVPINRIPIEGGTHPGPFEEEVELDLDVAIGMLPKLQQVLVYESDYRITAIIDGMQAAANDNLASVVSISFGGCEQNRGFADFLMPENTIFEQMAAQGQSVFAASGDSGSRDCLLHHTQNASALAVDDPASQPYVTGVGGTKLTVDATTGAYVGETVWNGFSNGGGAGGGGLSAYWSMPDYQTGPGVSNAFSTGKRQVPDVSANADPKAGYIVYTADPSCGRLTGTVAGTCFMASGGTSVAAPLWAAAAVLTNQHLIGAGYPRLGFANPLIYQFQTTNPTVFHDITAGHNCFDPTCDGTTDPRYPATVGYDMASGVGTFDAGAFADAVLSSMPHITGTTPASGPDTGGTTVTFTGTNFKSGATVSFGGTPATNVRVVDDKTLIAVTPPKPAGTVDVQIVVSGVPFNLSRAYTYSAQATPLNPDTSAPSSSAAASPPSSPPPATPAAKRKFKVANTDGGTVNLRDKPDTRTGKIVTTLPEGTEVQASGGAVAGEGGDWYPVQVGGKSGFIRADFLTPVSG